MSAVTLFLSRFPHDEFIFDNSGKDAVNIDDVDDLTPEERGALYRTPGRSLAKPPNRQRISGLWGTMLMMVGPTIKYASFTGPSPAPLQKDERAEELELTGRRLFVTAAGDDVASTKEFTTVERYRTNLGHVDKYDVGYVRLVRRTTPYGIRIEEGNKVVKTLRKGHDGLCLRVTGAAKGPQEGILIHEAPHAGWVIGCISPRPLGNRGVFDNVPKNPSQLSMLEIVAELRKTHNKGQLYVVPG